MKKNTHANIMQSINILLFHLTQIIIPFLETPIRFILSFLYFGVYPLSLLYIEIDFHTNDQPINCVDT